MIEEEEYKNTKTKITQRIIILLVIILFLLCIPVVAMIIYRVNNPTKITSYIDGVSISGLGEVIDIQKDAYGNTKIYIPIREFATFLNQANPNFQYQTYKGDYNPKTEDESKCYVIRNGYEVSLYSEGSKVVYKLNLQNGSSDYEECFIDSEIYMNNGKLYASEDAIEQSYNLYFDYDEEKKIIRINTLDYLINSYAKLLEKRSIDEYGIMSISDNKYSNWKSIFDGLLIVKSSKGKYGIIETNEDLSLVLEPQYDEINFVNDSGTFLVKSNGKIGLFSEDGKRKIDLIYDSITLMSKSTNLYVVRSNGQYGVVDENGNIIIYPEYERIGTDVGSFSYNGVKNGYILLDTLIPVMQNGKWGFFNTSGQMITDGFIYTTIGCTKTKKENNVYPLLQIPEYNVIVVGDDKGYYTFMDTSGNDKMLPFLFTQIYIKMTTGEESYMMTYYNNQDYDAITYLKQIGK